MKILALTIVCGERRKNGDRLLALFDVEMADFRLRQCSLLRTSRKFLLAQPPKLTDTARVIEILNPDIRRAMAEAAWIEFTRSGGVDPEESSE